MDAEIDVFSINFYAIHFEEALKFAFISKLMTFDMKIKSRDARLRFRDARFVFEQILASKNFDSLLTTGFYLI